MYIVFIAISVVSFISTFIFHITSVCYFLRPFIVEDSSLTTSLTAIVSSSMIGLGLILTRIGNKALIFSFCLISIFCLMSNVYNLKSKKPNWLKKFTNILKFSQFWDIEQYVRDTRREWHKKSQNFHILWTINICILFLLFNIYLF